MVLLVLGLGFGVCGVFDKLINENVDKVSIYKKCLEKIYSRNFFIFNKNVERIERLLHYIKFPCFMPYPVLVAKCFSTSIFDEKTSTKNKK